MTERRATYAIVVPTVLPARQGELAALLRQLRELAVPAPIAVSEHPAGGSPGHDCVRALELGGSLGRDWVLYLEDDAFLAPPFVAEVDRTLTTAAERGLRLTALYSDDDRAAAVMARGERCCVIPASDLFGSVCIGVRAEDVPALSRFAPRWYARHPEHWHASDLLVADFYAAHGSDALVCVPSVVQHRDPPSTLGHDTSVPRYSRTFRSAYGEVTPLPARAPAAISARG